MTTLEQQSSARREFVALVSRYGTRMAGCGCSRIAHERLQFCSHCRAPEQELAAWRLLAIFEDTA